MIILGVDPGSHRTGYGVVESAGSRLRLIDAGTVTTRSADPLASRLKVIHEALLEIIDAHAPDVVAVEDVFTARNARSSLILGQARGAILLSAALRDIEVAEYAPREVKMALTGNGAATKEQVGFMVVRMLAMSAPPKSLDASDALGIALCHALRRGRPPVATRAKGADA